MKEDSDTKFGNGVVTVEADETYFGRNDNSEIRCGYAHKQKLTSLVDRYNRQACILVIANLQGNTIVPILREHIAQEAKLMSD